MDLSPRQITELDPDAPVVGGVGARRRRKRWPSFVLLGLVILAGGLVVTKFLVSALDYYCNADEVGVKPDCRGDKRLRVQGTVERGSIVKQGSELRFTISFNGTLLPIRYSGTDPSNLFNDCIPVVVAGSMKDDVFVGDQLLVKHSNEYVAENEERLNEAESEPCATVAG